MYKFRLAYAVSCDSVKSAMPLVEFYYAVPSEMENNHPFLGNSCIGGNDISVSRTGADVVRSFL